MTIIPRNELQHKLKKSSTRTSILWTTPDLMNLPKTKVKVMQRVNALTTILPMTEMTEMALMVPMTLTVLRLIETLQSLFQFARGPLVFLRVLTMTRRQSGPPTPTLSMALMLRLSTPSLWPVPLHSLAGLKLTRNNAHMLLTPLVSFEVLPETTLLC